MPDISHPWDIREMLAAQLYTVRDYTASPISFAATLKKISAIGYRGVQLSAVGAMSGEKPKVTAVEARNLLDEFGLKCVATHRNWHDLVERTDDEIQFHRDLACTYAAIGSIPPEYRSYGLNGYKKWAEDARSVAEKLAVAGIRFGYHNHEFEFEKSRTNRVSFYEVLCAETEPQVFLEADIYWIQHAGVDPVTIIDKLKGRLPVVHVKDKEILDGKAVMAPVGEGNLDWIRIIPALKDAGTEWFCVEQDDCYRDPFDCLESSFLFLGGYLGIG